MYHTHGACIITDSLTGTWDLQFNARSEWHSWGGLILGRIPPVSYTHLDVYKRQRLGHIEVKKVTLVIAN